MLGPLGTVLIAMHLVGPSSPPTSLLPPLSLSSIYLQRRQWVEMLEWAWHYAWNLIVVKIAATIERKQKEISFPFSKASPCFTHSVFSWCSPRNILFEISLILFSPNCRSCMRDAPSKAFGSMPVSWLRFSSSLTKCGRRPNNPSELMRPSSLSLSSLKREFRIMKRV